MKLKSLNSSVSLSIHFWLKNILVHGLVMLERENENTSVQFTNYLLIDALSQACSISNKRSAGNNNELYRDNKGTLPPANASVSYG
jgi:hypothetical protein